MPSISPRQSLHPHLYYCLQLPLSSPCLSVSWGATLLTSLCFLSSSTSNTGWPPTTRCLWLSCFSAVNLLLPVAPLFRMKVELFSCAPQYVVYFVYSKISFLFARLKTFNSLLQQNRVVYTGIQLSLKLAQEGG